MRLIKGRANSSSKQAVDTFTGEVWSDGVLMDDDFVRINNVIFTPCARTYWHYHEQGQILQVFRGRGFVCSEGEEPVELNEGDTVWVPGGEKHWHGGSKDTLLGHTAISLGKTTWLQEVTEEEYGAAAH